MRLVRPRLFTFAFLGAAFAGGAPALAQTNLVQNGGFELGGYTGNTQFDSSPRYDVGPADWTNASTDYDHALTWWFSAATATTVSARNGYNDPLTYLWPGVSHAFGPSPDGGLFVVADADPAFSGAITQEINGLVVGHTYALTFDEAFGQLRNRSGATYNSWEASLGGQMQRTPVVDVASHDFTGWSVETLTYTATGVSELLSFLADGSPGGEPPVAMLDGVSLVDVTPAPAPEPAAASLLALGALAVAGLRLRPRRAD